MKFTDDDLKRLKEHHFTKAYACAHMDGEHRGCIDVLDVDKFAALIARLEAAEEFADEAIAHCKFDCMECSIAREAWNKAAGK